MPAAARRRRRRRRTRRGKAARPPTRGHARATMPFLHHLETRMTSLAGKTLFITGASRGIGLAIALRAARDGANVAIAAKSAVPNPKLPGTIHSAAEAVDAAGGRGLA